MTDVNVERDDTGRGIPVINPLELPTGNYDRKQLFLMWAGQTGTRRGYVWADHLEDAFEEWVEYLDENAPGLLVSPDEFNELLDEAAREKGFDSWADAEAKWLAKNGKHAGWSNDMASDYSEIIEAAEADLTLIGHTTLKSGAMHIAGHEWGGDDIGGAELDKVWNACAEAYYEQYEEWPEPPRGIKPTGGKGTRITDLDGVSKVTDRYQQPLPRWARPPRR